jgi:hypothetical protein
MAETLTEMQREFIRRYLSFDPADLPSDEDGQPTGDVPGGSGDGFADAWDAARDEWMKAEETVAQQIKALQGKFRESGVPELAEIANIGLPALTGNTRTKVMASVFDVDRVKTASSAKVLAKAEKNLAAMSQHLRADPRIEACDTNHFGIKMSIAATLGGAIEALRKALRDAGVS